MQHMMTPLAVAALAVIAFFLTDLLSDNWWRSAGLPLVIFVCLIYLLVKLALYLNRAGWNTHTRTGDGGGIGGFDGDGDGGD